MNCLHICNDFYGSAVHKNLYKSLSEHLTSQTVFYPSRSYLSVPDAKTIAIANTKVIHSKPLRNYHKIFFRNKINHLFNDLEKKTTLSKFDFVHATTLFSDGALALRIKKKYGIPYILAVRATDIDGFFKYRPDLKYLGKEILKESSHVVFITEALKNRFLNHRFIKNDSHNVSPKFTMIPNGINSYWLNNLAPKKDLEKPAKILYVGTFEKRKNAVSLINSIIELNKNGVICELTLVGDGGSLQEKVENMANQHDFIKYLGRINNIEKLREVYNQHQIFALPSKVETFGLVYLEALSQGIPILYLKNQGVDGLFKFNVGERCDDDKVSTIAKKLQYIMQNYSQYQIEKLNFSEFSWDTIALTYTKMFKKILE